MPPASPAICRCWFIPRVRRRRPPISAIAWRTSSARSRRCGRRRRRPTPAGSVDAMQKAVDHIKKAGIKTKRIAAEFGFLPYDASIVLRQAFPDAEWVDALFVLERQRAEEIGRRTGEAEDTPPRPCSPPCRRSSRSQARRHQGRYGRSAAPRGNQPRPDLRILPDHRRHQHEPRALRTEMGAGRHHVDR